METRIKTIANDLAMKPNQIQAVLQLTKEGQTIPFIARYRKELTGNLDEVQIKRILDDDRYLSQLVDRRDSILASLKEQEKLTPALADALHQAKRLTDLEDLYLPYKEKRQTKADLARKANLAPLARLLLEKTSHFKEAAAAYVSADFASPEAALEGACAILLETLSTDVSLRSVLYQTIKQKSQLTAQLKDAENDVGEKFQLYYDFQESIQKIKDYQVLALNRGEKKAILKVAFKHPTPNLLTICQKRFKITNPYTQKIAQDLLKKRLLPSLERKIRSELTQVAEDNAIALFSTNLRQLLLTPPLRGKRVLGFDPAFRTGAKLALVDETGKLLTTQVIYVLPPASQEQIAKAKELFTQLLTTYQIDLIAIGNGTASRESERFVAAILEDFPTISYVIVDESGASVYSASAVARAEFPELPLEKRSAISIARRLQDPLAELVKIDPKAIGVGQYQHDVNQKQLASQLDFVVETVVNQVGVNINTASAALLSYVSGLTKSISDNIVAYRNTYGAITSREDIKKIPRLGAKTFEQAAGFLRIPEAANVLDRTGVHPESYPAVARLFEQLKISQLDEQAKQRLKDSNQEQLARDLGLGEATLADIIAELLAPGRDFREAYKAPVLRQGIMDLQDLTIGQSLEGTVRNIVDFGAFVDVGLHDDGLIHISQMSTSFVKHPSQLLAVGDIVTVWVTAIDLARHQLNLSLVKPDELD